MMNTKYGYITTEQFEQYKKSLIGRIYAILPMKEEGSPTIRNYIERINRELVKNIDIFEHCERAISVVCILEYLICEQEHSVYRQEVLHCCNIISGLGGVKNV